MSMSTALRTEIVIFDSRVDDLHVLLNGLQPGIEAYVLHPEEDGIAQISDILTAHRDITALHIISHGAPGQIFIGKSAITSDDLEAGDIKLWQQALSADAEILLYGCNVASGDTGAKLIDELHRQTGAKVAASESLTGHTAQGGNWELEVTTAPMHPVLALQPETLNNYHYVFGTPPSLSVTDTSNYGNSPVIVAPNLTISDPDGEILTGAKVSIGSQFNSTQDRLGISGQVGTSGTVSGLSWNYNTTTGVMTLSGSANFTTYQSVLRQVTYSNTSPTPANTNPRSVEFTLGSNLANPDNGHFYEFVSSPQISWTNARNAAASKSLFGLQGYLATITSATENNFIASKIQGEGWIGASDAATEGVWRWETGPEAGTQFWQGLGSGSSVGGRYSNWDTGEPNDASSVGGEDYGHLLADGNRVGKWNDYPVSFSGIGGYVVEYGGMSGDPTLNITGAATVRFSPTVQFAPGSFSSPENVGTSNVLTLTRSGDLSSPSTAIVSITGGTATGGGTDYTSSAFPFTVNFAANETSKTVALPINNDTLFEGNETINLSVAPGTNAVLGTQTTTIFTITDNDTAPVVTLSPLTSILENGGTATITANLSNPSTQAVTVNLGYTGTATGSGTDYNTSGPSITIPAGSTTGTAAINITNDILDEDNETVIVDITSVTNGTESGVQRQTLTITDDDAPPTVTLGINSDSIAETGGTATVTATLSTASSKEVTVNLGYTGTATGNGTDYTGATTITIPAGSTTGTATISAVGDSIAEGNETLEIAVNSVTNGTENGVQQVAATLVDDDVAAVVVSPSTLTTREGGTAVDYGISLSTVPTGDVTVVLDLGTNPEASLSATTLTFTPANALTPQTVTVSATDDIEVEGDQIQVIGHSATSTDPNYNSITIADTTVNIADNDIDYTISASGNLPEGNSGSQAATFTITRSGDISGISEVTYAIAGTATNGTDYNNIGGTSGATAMTGTVNFAATETSKTITLDILGDTTFENDETIMLTLSEGTADGTVQLTDSPASITIINDEPEPPVPPEPPIPPEPPVPSVPPVPPEPTPEPTPSIPSDGDPCLLISNPPLFPSANPTTTTQAGTDTDDFLLGDLANNHFEGLGGQDLLKGLEGDDNLFGGSGNDFLSGNQGRDFIDGGDGDDIVFAGQNEDGVKGGLGNDSIAGDLGNDHLRGEDGNDLIFGNAGTDYIEGGTGNDLVYGGKGNDALVGGDEDDVMLGEIGHDCLHGQSGDDLIFGGINEDRLDGGDGNDSLFGGQNNDNLNGSAGSDILSGDMGDDTLTGGDGADQFNFSLGDGSNFITDFTDGVDKIGLQGLTFEQLNVVEDLFGNTVLSAGNLSITLPGVGSTLIEATDFVVI